MKRKIAAIIAADVAGYSRLVEENEEDTLRRFIAASQVFKTLVQDHYGRIFNTAGDAILAEFPSPVEAVRCAAGIQTRVRELNQSQSKNRQLLFRIGISIGDVIEHENDLLGDGVNIAARLQTLASPGGLSISHWVHEQIAGKIQLEFRDAGWHSVKNIAKPVHVFLADIGTSAIPFVAERSASPGQSKREIPRPVIVSLAVVLIAVSIAALIWHRSSRTPSSDPIPTMITVPGIPQTAEPAPGPAPAAKPPVTAPVAPATSDTPVLPVPPPIEAALPYPAPLQPALQSPAAPGRPVEPPAIIVKQTEPAREDPAVTPPASLAPPATPPLQSPPRSYSLPLPSPPQSPPDSAQPPPNHARSAAVCAEIRERAQLGDISTDERLMLRTNCK